MATTPDIGQDPGKALPAGAPPSRARRLIAPLAAVAALGCGGHVPVAPAAAAPAPRPVQEYRIQAGDQLDVKFFYNPELNDLVTVRPDGMITLQLVHDVAAAGLSPNELTSRLVELLRKDLNRPEVAVIVRSFAAQRVFVDGEVNKPGVVALLGAMSVIQAIAQAGGVRETARTGQVLVIRRLPDAAPVVMAVNVGKVLDGSDLAQDVLLQPADVVFVPRSAIADVNLFVDQYLRRNIPLPVYLPVTLQ